MQNNLTPQLSDQDLRTNIDALVNQNAPHDVVQSYIDNYKADGKGGYALKTATPTPDVTPPEQGMLAKIGSSLIQAPQRLGQGVENLVAPAVNAVGSAFGAKGNIVPENQATGTDIFGGKVDTLGYKDGQALSGVPLAKDVAGNVLQNAALMVPGGAIAKDASVLTKIGQGIKIGATGGALQGTGQGLQDQKDTTGVLESGLVGGVVGGVTGGVVSGVGNVAGKAYGATTDLVNKDVQTLRADKITEGLTEQNSKLKTAQKAFDNNTITRTTDTGAEQTITPIDTVAKYNLTPEVKNGSLLTGHNITQIDDHLDTLDNTITSKLADTKITVPIDVLRQDMINAAKKNPILQESGKVQSTIDAANKRIDDFQATYGDSIPLTTINRIRIRANKDFSPDTADASLAIGDAGRRLVHDATGDNTIKGLLQDQGELLAARKYLNTLNGTKVSHGSIGKYALRTIGAVIGSTVEKAPVIGPLIGAFGGEAVARGLQQAQFKSVGAEGKALVQGLTKKLVK